MSMGWPNSGIIYFWIQRVECLFQEAIVLGYRACSQCEIELKELKRKLLLSGMLISLIVSIGTIGYMTIEDWPLLDAFYMTMITLTTVGFKEIHDLSVAGKLFTIILVISGVGTVFYSLGIGAQFIVEEEMHREFRRERVKMTARRLKGRAWMM